MARKYPRWGRPYWDPMSSSWRIHRFHSSKKIRTHRIVPIGSGWQRKNR